MAKTKKSADFFCFLPCMMPYILSWSLFCSLQSRSSWRTCCWGEQAFFSLSRLFRSTLCPGRLSKSLSRGTEDSRREERDWKTASSHRVTSGINCKRKKDKESRLKTLLLITAHHKKRHSSGHIIQLDQVKQNVLFAEVHSWCTGDM